MKDKDPPDCVHWVTLKSRRLNPGTNNTSSSKISYVELLSTSVILMEAVPFFGALTILPLATSTRDLEEVMSKIRSSGKGVIWLEQPESISQSER